MIVSSLGNKDILKLHKTAFLCSRDIPASIVLKCYDWAVEERDKGTCVIGGFHSRIEKDVFHYLLAGTQPVIMALARGMKKRIEPELKKEIDKGRLLVVTPFEKEIEYVTSKTAEVRNRLMIELADKVVIGYASKGGMLENLILEIDVNKLNTL
ncbi:MAG: DNA-binding protein [Deltaproteobacteria bacterium]|nr:DNA-binding protein [Deltaproteobacteria bacterium]